LAFVIGQGKGVTFIFGDGDRAFFAKGDHLLVGTIPTNCPRKLSLRAIQKRCYGLQPQARYALFWSEFQPVLADIHRCGKI
jgi:hypothetical protein